MDIKGTTSRLRRTFHYPTDDSSNGGTPEVLDEEGKQPVSPPDMNSKRNTDRLSLSLFLAPITEQETLIQTLSEQNATTNQQYQMLLLALPILASIPYILALFRPATFLIALLGLSSLASTAFLLISLPATETSIPLLDAWSHSAAEGSAATRGPVSSDGDEEGESSTSALAGPQGGGGWWGLGSRGGGDGLSGLGTLDRRRRRRRSRANSLTYEVPKSPLERHLPFLNMGLCAILVLAGLSAARGESENNSGGSDGSQHHSHQFGWLGLGNLPAIVYIVVIIAKVVMASVDPEKELAALRYGYKGA